MKTNCLIALVLAISFAGPVKAIVNGEPFKYDQTFSVFQYEASEEFLCSAVMISPKVALTAGHCFMFGRTRYKDIQKIEEIRVRYPNTDSFSRKSAKVHLSPDILSDPGIIRKLNDEGRLDFKNQDLAILVFNEPVFTSATLVPATLVNEDEGLLENLDEVRFQFWGVGDPSFSGPDRKIGSRNIIMNRLKFFEARVIKESGTYGFRTESIRPDTCSVKGDSGGGLFLINGSEKILVGIQSGMTLIRAGAKEPTSCFTKNLEGAVMQASQRHVDLRPHLSWIRGFLME